MRLLMVHTFAKGTSSVMVARGALWNPSIFCPKGKLPWEDVKREYVRKVSVSRCCVLSVVHDGIR